MFMLKRTPTTTDGKIVDRLQESTRVFKPFKPPTIITNTERVQPQRKRKRVSYKEQGGEKDDDDEECQGRRKKKKNGDQDGTYTEEELKAAIKTYPVYEPKPFEMVRRFSMPTMRNGDGEVIQLISTGIALGIRPQAKIIPRPLHDPMEDHAIVLYDPTIDDRETDEERKEREKEEARDNAEKEAREKTAGMHNPHKNLRSLLGEGKGKREKIPKIPVVIDPRLSKVLRPHQIEGVKVGLFHSFLLKLTVHDAVPIQVYNRHDGGEPVRLHHGGRDGARKDTAVYHFTLDTCQTIPSSWKAYTREVHHCMSRQFGEKLGKRNGYVNNVFIHGQC